MSFERMANLKKERLPSSACLNKTVADVVNIIFVVSSYQMVWAKFNLKSTVCCFCLAWDDMRTLLRACFHDIKL
jgi:hypothetical protein